MICRTLRPFVWVCIWLMWMGCTSEEKETPETVVTQPRLFTALSPQQTGIDFSNTLLEHPSPHRNELLYEYFSNGGGVAVGDLNGDGLDDLYFSGNMTFNRLYLNKGGMQFQDITTVAGVGGRKNTWKTGVTIADVNGDGRLDIYASYSGDLPVDRRVDALYINMGNGADDIPRFEDQAEGYGLAQPHSSNQGYFFDYDRDEDLDLFLLTHNVKRTLRLDEKGTRTELAKDDPMSGFRFYRNDGGRFTDITRTSGISSSSLTYGLGAGISDINKDGWMDMYVGNDYSPPDYLYINNGDGTFTDQLAGQMGHTSNASMGIDVADINNDGWSDIIVLDMLPESHQRQKTMFIPEDRDMFDMFVRMGFHHQYLRNTLQLNNGDGSFSEIGQLAGISNTDWSWTPLIADLDNDGHKDLYVSNGTLHDTIDRDFLDFKSEYVASRPQGLEPADVAFLMDQMPSAELKNYAFKNGGDLQFQDVSAAWGVGQSLKSTGAAYADLDNDGDLDLITNNVNAPAYIFENQSRDISSSNYLQIDLIGEGLNTFGLGAKVTLFAGGASQYVEQMPIRGYLSNVTSTLHFGLGNASGIDSLQIIWPDQRIQTLTPGAVNQRIKVNQEDATGRLATSDQLNTAAFSPPIFEMVRTGLQFEHQMAGEIDDFQRQPLLDHPMSFGGPALAKADVNGDGLEDVFAGGGAGQSGQLFLQQQNGRFAQKASVALRSDAPSEDVAAVFVDANADGNIDLYVGSGGYGAFDAEDAALQDRLYLNDGEGNFTKAAGALPEMRSGTGVVAVHDINADGQPDLFVGGKTVPGNYPQAPRSYVLINDGRGVFTDQTASISPALLSPGMISDAVWHDLDGDGGKELVIAGLWMPISVYGNTNGTLTNDTDRYFDKAYSGLWESLLVDDLNGDGVADLVAGNLGLNSQLKASDAEPAKLYYADLNNDGSMDPLLDFYMGGKSYPYASLDELRGQMPRVAAQFRNYRAYATASIEDIFSDGRLFLATKLEANHLATSLFIGTEDGRFEYKELPLESQFSPVFTINALDYNTDGNTDLVLAGNTNDATIRFGKYDANYGVLLKGNENAAFEYIPQRKSGLQLRGAVRSVLEVNNHFVFGVNKNALSVYRMSSK